MQHFIHPKGLLNMKEQLCLKFIHIVFPFLLSMVSVNVHGQVVINEIMLNPQTNATSAEFQSLKMCAQPTYGREYIELYNPTACAVDISCYIIGFNGDFGTGINGTFRFPTGTSIPANGFLSIGGPNSGATLDLTSFCNTNFLSTDADRWFIPNGDGYMMLWDGDGIPIDAVYWTVNANEPNKWGTDSDISAAPGFIAAGDNCTFIDALVGPSSIPLSPLVGYAGQASAIGTVVHRVPDGAATWQTNGVPSVNACNAACNSVTSSFLLNATITQPTCGNSDGVISFNPSPVDTYFFNWPFPSTGTVNSASDLAAGSYLVTITNLNGCSIDTTIILTEDCQGCGLSAAVTVVPNSECQPCDYNGPSILINELMISPTANDGSLSGNGGVSQGRGEWIELFNPNWCDSVDISCFYLGNSAPGTNVASGTQPGGYVIPAGTVIPPLGLAMIRGGNVPPVPSNLLLQNGGNIVELVVPFNISDIGVCVGGSTQRLWFPNAGGWFAFYDSNGVPQDAVSWANEGSNADRNGNPCIAQLAPCNFSGTLASYNQIPTNRRFRATTVDASNHTGQSIRRMPDGGAWSGFGAPTYGTCNDIQNCENQGIAANCNGSGTVTISSGLAPFTYLWNDPLAQTTQTANNLCEGTYQVTVRDANQCEEIITVTVVDNPFQLTTSITNPGCQQSNGFVSFTPFNANYTYNWTPNVSNTNSASNLPAGSYSIVISEGSCSFDTTVVLVAPGEFTTNVTAVNTTCGFDNGSISIANEPAANYIYTWTPNISTLNNVSNLTPGTYQIHITDNVCQESVTVIIEASQTLSEQLDIQNTSCAQNNGYIGVMVSPPSNYTYLWTPDVSTASSSDSLAPGNYTIFITDGTCELSTEAIVEPSVTPTDLTFNITSTPCNASLGSVSVAITTGGVAPYQYNIGGSAFGTTLDFNGLPTGTFTIGVQDVNGCIYNEDAFIPELPGPSSLTFTTLNPNCGIANGAINIEAASGGVLPYQFLVNGQNVNETLLTDLSAGTYIISAVDVHGCAYTLPASLEMEDLPINLFVPNVFTPNDDLANPLWQVSAECIESFNCRIFNRWGSLIYEYDDILGGWDGKTSNGKDVTEGVYFYKFTLGFFGNREDETYHGHITLIR
jgi:gliding motility-associated-like protein